MRGRLTALRTRDADRGATAVEYGLMIALIAGVITAIVTTIGQTLLGVFTNAIGFF